MRIQHHTSTDLRRKKNKIRARSAQFPARRLKVIRNYFKHILEKSQTLSEKYESKSLLLIWICKKFVIIIFKFGKFFWISSLIETRRITVRTQYFWFFSFQETFKNLFNSNILLSGSGLIFLRKKSICVRLFWGFRNKSEAKPEMSTVSERLHN